MVSEQAAHRATSDRAVQSPLSAACLVPPALLIVGAGAVALALIAEHGFGLQPCALCYYQRLPYSVLALVGVIGLTARDRLVSARLLLGVGVAISAASAALAGFHVGVEQGYWQGPSACSAPELDATDLESFRAAVMANDVVPCDAVPWSLFGISMAGYNGIFSLLLALGGAVWHRALPRSR